jgi:photosystem II stability/assembly factor-like uncharacterized protein
MASFAPRLTAIGFLLVALSCSVRKNPISTLPANTVPAGSRADVRDPETRERESLRHEIGSPHRQRNLREPEGSEIESDSWREAAEFFRRKRWAQGNELPAERYLEAQRQIRNLPRYSLGEGRIREPESSEEQTQAEAAPTFGSWQSLGPGNIGGRVRALAINPKDPTIMYAGTATGGVWKTVDGGQTWFPLTDFLPVLSVSSLVMSPKDPNTLFVGTGEVSRGAGIFKTTNGGKTWVQLPGTVTPDFYYVYKLAFSVARPTHLYAATDSGVWMSRDDGATWINSYVAGPEQSVSCSHLVVRSDQPTDIVYANCSTYNYSTGSSGYAVYRNTDAAGKGNWKSVLTQSNMADVALAVAPSHPNTIYALAVNGDEKSAFNNALLAVYRSTSGGDHGTWQTRTSNADPDPVNPNILSYPSCPYYNNDHHGQGGYNLDIAVDPTNPNRVFAGGIDLFRSDDGGANWGYINDRPGGDQEYAHVDQHILVFHPNYNGQDNQTLFVGNDGGVFRTDAAAGQSATGPTAFCYPNPGKVGWVGLNHGFVATQFYHGTVYPGGAAHFGGTQDNGTPRGNEVDGSNGWSYLFGGDGGQVAVDPIDVNTLFFEYINLSIVKSADGGYTASMATNGITEPSLDFLFINYYAMDPFDSLRLYTGGNSLWRTLDGGSNWSAASTALANANDGYQQAITTVTISPADPNVVYFGTTDGRIYRNDHALSASSGTQWTYSRPGGGWVSRIVVDPRQPKTVYAVNSSFRYSDLSGQIFRSTDGGITWSVLNGSGNTAFPDIPAHVLLIDPNDSSKLYVGTDIGVFVSVDAGASWLHDDNLYANAITESLLIEQNGGTNWLYAFTHGRGAWRVALPGGSGSPCTYSLSTNTLDVPALGGVSTINVNTRRDCLWSALVAVPPGQFPQVQYPPSPVVSIQSPATGQGPEQLYVVASYNPGNTTRTATFYVQDQSVVVNQPVDLSNAHAVFNDEVASARTITPLPYSDNIWNGNYTQNATDPIHSCTGAADFRTGWWKVVAPATGRILATATDQDGGTGIVLTAYPLTGSTLGKEAACAVLQQKASTYGSTASIQFDVVTDSAYAIEISAPVPTASAGGSIGLAVSLLPNITLTPGNVNLGPGGRQPFSSGMTNSMNTAVRWTLSPPVGTITPAGLYTAPASISAPVAVTVIAQSLANPAAKATATVNLTPAAQ